MLLRCKIIALSLLATISPGDPWGDVHDSIFLRTAPDGETYGQQELDPLLWSWSRWLAEPERMDAVAEALGKLKRENATQRPVRDRLVMQRDLWAVFDWLVDREKESALVPALARAMHTVSATSKELGELATTAEGVDGFPRGVLDASDGWVRMADELGRAIAPAHDFHFDGRSYFEVLIRMPEGRMQTVQWLEKLGAEPGLLEGAPESKRFRRDAPELPKGTQVALVRRALAITADGELIVSDLVESVQLRQILDSESPNPDAPHSGSAQQRQEQFALAQPVREFRLARSGTLDLVEFSANDLDFSRLGSHGIDPFTGSKEHWEAKPPGLVKCFGCHAQPGIYSVNSITRVATGPGTIFIVEPREEPTRAVPSDGSKARAAALAFKRERPSWKVFQSFGQPLPR